MLKFLNESLINGDIFNAPEPYKVITVNCVGAMGRGIALSCKEKYPTIYEDYRKRCQLGTIKIGSITIYEEEKLILVPTKDHFKDPSKVEYVIAGLQALVGTPCQYEGGVALPPLGMAHGWLSSDNRAQCYRAMVQLLRFDARTFKVYLPEYLYQECRRVLK